MPSLPRRTLLISAGTLLTAGCADRLGSSKQTSSPPSTTPAPTPTPTTTPEQTSETSPHLERFGSFLQRKGIDVRKLTTTASGDVVRLQYATTKTSDDALSREIGTIAGGFFREVRDGWNVSRLESTILTMQENPIATWHAKAAWYREYQQGKISADKLSLRVLKTLERV